MIRLLLRLPIVLLLIAPLTWAGILVLGSDPTVAVTDGYSRLERAYPQGPERELIVRRASTIGASLVGRIPGAGPASSARIRAGIVVSTMHSLTVATLFPFTFLLVAAGVTGGLIFRERMRNAEGYASPTAAGLGRAMVGLGLFWLGLFALTPLQVSFAWLYLALLSTSVGGSIYAANLPLKV